MEQKLALILQKCKTIKQLKQTHLQILINCLKNRNFLATKLMSLSSDFISLDYANKVFQDVSKPNLISYNTLIKCSIGKSHENAIFVYNRMRELDISSNSFTFTFLLSCFESFHKLECGKMLHCHVLKMGFESSIFVMNTLLDFYAKCGGDLGLVTKVFDEMTERDVVSWNTMIRTYMSYGEIDFATKLFDSMPEKNLVTWNTVVSGLVKGGKMELANEMFQQMPERNSVSWNVMISGYVKSGDVKSAKAIFDEMPERSIVSWTTMVSGYATTGDIGSARMIFSQMPVKNVVSWNAMIAGCVNCHMFDEALSVFHHMLSDGKCKPDQTTLISVLSACTHLNSHEHGKWIESYIRKNNFELSVPLGNALIDMFSKCGDLENAKAIFEKMPERCIITWTTMVSGLTLNGCCREALELFDKMCSEGLKPDDVIFIAVLSACNHGGLVEDGKRVFSQMVHDFGIEPRIEHYGCMVDILGRAGRIEEAIGFIESMNLEPNAIIWATLLSACKIHGNGSSFESSMRKILEQEPNNPSYLKLITNISSSAGQWQDALNFRVATRDGNMEKVPGCSSIQVGESVHEFVARDTSHPGRKEVYRALRSLNRHLKPMHRNVIALSLFLSPTVTFKKIIKKRSTEQFSGMPYVMALLNCLLYFWYGLPFITRNNYLVSAINGAGIVIESTFVLIFLIFSPKKEKAKVLGILVCIIALFSTVALVSIFAFHKGNERKLFCGFVSMIFAILMYAAPLSSMVPNSFGCVLGAMQLTLYAIYRSNKGDTKKATIYESSETGKGSTLAIPMTDNP
ncbi:hypothetical protein BUALT_Bualt01G0015700 [Buddleja alternifolia]|uniref:Chlororespiratory reduction 4 n=1 Tax=Buddleja alternifolia TaxID=168488 RepID=A0AAV6Y3P4_9LAMI|nr:hypothetical protein BUALT_Bualt01G0015700 [Buddleja alternifolia]